MKKLFMFLLLGLFLLSFTYALEQQPLEKVGWDWDNIEQFTRDITTSKYGKYEIRNSILGLSWFQYGKVADIELKENSDVCGENCFAEKEITLYQDGILVDEITFETKQPDGSWKYQPIRSYQFSYQGEVQDYKSVCNIIGESQNGTIIQECNQVEDGTHVGKINYRKGEVVKAGTYLLRLDGKKKPGRTVDWKIKTNGIWTNEWATWGNISLGDSAEVTLNSPQDNFISPTSIVQFNCSVNVTGGATLVNVSLYTNQSGIWEVKNSTELLNIDEIMSYYSFEDSSGNATDTKEINDLVNSGVNYSQIGLIDNSYIYESGDKSQIDSFTLDTINNQYSWNFWGFSTDDTGIFFEYADSGRNNVYSFQYSGSTTVSTSRIGGGGFEDHFIGINPNTYQNVWVMWTIVYDQDDNSMKIYRNSASVHNYTLTEAPTLSTGNIFTIGGHQSFANFDGKIDEFGFFNNALSTDQIVDLYNSGAGILLAGSSTQTWNRTITDITLWTCQACDSDGDCGFATENRTVSLDSSLPIIDVQTPNGTLGYNFIGGNETLNVTFIDINLEACSFDYNGTNITIEGCLTGIKNSTEFILEENNLNMTIHANDTIGNQNSTFIEWNYEILEISQSFNNQTIEGSTESFSINLTVNQIPTSANLIYNGTSTSADIDSSNFPEIIISESIIIPNVPSQSNLSFLWNIITPSFNISTRSNNQTVNNIAIDNCSSFTNVLFNYTMVDESEQSFLDGSSENVSLEVDISIFSSNRLLQIINFSTIFTGTNPNAICSESSFLNASDFILDSVAKYSSAARAIEYYNIRGFKINNQTETQNITLFDVKISEATDFQVTLKDSTFIIVEGALIQVQRQFVQEGVFKTVEIPITDSNGKTIVHLIKNDVVYNFIATKNGEIIGTFNNLIAFCEDETIGQCFIALNAITGTTPTFNPDKDIGISASFLFNDTTRDLILTFSTNDGSVRTILLSAVKMDQLGNTSVCSTSITSSSGTLTCNVPASLGNETIITSIFVDSELKLTSYFSAAPDLVLGDGGYFLLLFLVISLTIMFSESKSMMVFGVILGFITGGLLFFIKGGIIGSGSAVMWLIIMGIILISKLQKEGQT